MPKTGPIFAFRCAAVSNPFCGKACWLRQKRDRIFIILFFDYYDGIDPDGGRRPKGPDRAGRGI